jgi:hypothetical protein
MFRYISPKACVTPQEKAMIVSTLYLPGTATNVQYQSAPAGGIAAGHKRCPGMTSTVR